MVEPDPIVIVIDDDAAFRRSTERLVRPVGRYEVRTFAAAAEFLRNPRPEAPACVVLDVRLPGLSGLDLQRELITAGVQIPIIFTTGYGNIPMSVQARKAGAVEFLTKPFCPKDLLDASRWPSDKVMSDMRPAPPHTGLPVLRKLCRRAFHV
jgi:FixJ family two-component response regulator